MDGQERIEQVEETTNNEPMTLDEALAAARAEVEARESAQEAPVQEEAVVEEAPVEEAPAQTEEVVPEQARP